MCGISGFFAIKPQSSELLHAMNTLVRHRGPDDEGYVIFSRLDRPACVLAGHDTQSDCYTSALPYAPKNQLAGSDQILLGLGHRRLSIIDLSVTGHQPMCSPDSRYWIVYNGEIYNYIELREELEGKGYTFTSQSDTEVILAAWRCWGQECMSRLNGMFAFAMYDRAKESVFLVRDRFGVKPLYYWVSQAGIIAFASEIKQFTVLPGWDPCLNGQVAYDFLIWGFIDHTGETMFRGVHQVRPGTFLRIDLKDMTRGGFPLRPNEPLKAEPWYELKPRNFEGTMFEAAAQYSALFHDAVKLRLRSDVPVGSCLSGGLDSSSIVCVVSKILNTESSDTLQKSFSACAHEKEFDEREYIDAVVESTGLDAHYVYPSLYNLFKVLGDIIWVQDEPFGSTSIYAQWYVFELASKNNVKVMLDGQGADESLGGYPIYFAMRQASLLRQLSLPSFIQDIEATQRLHHYAFSQSLKDIASLVLPAWQRRLISRIFRVGDITPTWLNLAQMGARATNPFSYDGKEPRNVLELSMTQLRSTSLPMLLHWEDRNSMAHSIEARVPFLDYRLVEFSLGLPEEFKLKNGVTKSVLRAAMQDTLPEKIRHRMDKLGFASPGEVWMLKYAPQKFRDELRKAIDASRGILSGSASRVLDDMIDGRRPFSYLVWRLICFGHWLHQFNISI